MNELNNKFKVMYSFDAENWVDSGATLQTKFGYDTIYKMGKGTLLSDYAYCIQDVLRDSYMEVL